MNPFREHRLIFITQAQVDAQRAAAGASPVTNRYNSRAADANAQRQAAEHQTVVANNQDQFVQDARQQNIDAYNSGQRSQEEYNSVNASLTGRAMDNAQMRTGAASSAKDANAFLNEQAYAYGSQSSSPFKASEDLKKGRQSQLDQTKGYVSIPQYDKDGNVVGYSYQEDPQKTAEARAAMQKHFDMEDANNASNRDYQARTASESAAAAGATEKSGRQPFGNRKSEEGKAANEKALQGPSATSSKKAAATSISQKTALDSYLATLTPEQRQMLQPITMGMNMMDTEFKNIADQAQENKTEAEMLADQTANNQGMVLQMTMNALKSTKDETKAFLDGQMEEMNKNLQSQRDQTKNWLKLEEQRLARQMQADKAKTVEDMAFAAAVTGGTFSSSANFAISKAEAQADQAISEMHAQYGLKSVDADLSYTAAYTELNGKYMEGMLTALQDYRKDSLDILGKQFANEDARGKAKLDAKTKYTDTLNGLAMTKASAISQAMNNFSSILQADKAAQVAAKQWEADYTYRVDTSNRSFAFQEDQFQKNYNLQVGQMQLQGKQLQLQDWQNQFNARTTAAQQARTEVQGDRNVSAYESTYRPAWDSFSVAYNTPEGTAGRDLALTSSFTQMLRSANSLNPQDTGGVLSAIGMGTFENVLESFKGKTSLSPDEVGQMHDIAQGIYSKAQERRNDAVERVMATVQRTNMQFTDDFFKIKPEDVGIQTSPLDQEAIGIINTLPPETKNRITTYRYGGKDITTNYEMQLRLQEADRMFFADTGQHIKVTSHYRSTATQADLYAKSQTGAIGRAAPPGGSEHERGAAVDISPDQWKIAAPYLMKAGLLQLPASIDQEDPGHFSLTGR